MMGYRNSRIMLLAGLLLLVPLIGQLNNLRLDYAYNRAIVNQEYAKAAQHTSGYGKLASAREFQLAGNHEQAVQHYIAIDPEKFPGLKIPVLAGLAQSYVELAATYEKSGDSEQRIPLLELAKENYRKILTDEPDNWAIRVNLAQVLRMLPDPQLIADEDEDVMPERSPQAPVQTIGHERLP